MKIVTDCAADLLPEEAEQLDISVVPLFINFGEETIDATTIDPDDFYTRLAEAHPNIPTTSLPSPTEFTTIYQKLLEDNDRVLSVHISSGLSGTFNSARIAAETFAEGIVTVVDSLTLSGGLHFQVLAAAKAVKAGWDLPAIRERLSQIQQQAEVIYTLETLEYLAAGGRIGRVQAIAGSLLNLKPIIHVDRGDGKYDTIEKTRTMKRALSGITKHLAGLYSDTPVAITVLHGQIAEQAANLKAQLEGALNAAHCEIRRISPVLGVHTGPGIVGTAVVPAELLDIS